LIRLGSTDHSELVLYFESI